MAVSSPEYHQPSCHRPFVFTRMVSIFRTTSITRIHLNENNFLSIVGEHDSSYSPHKDVVRV